MSEQFKHDDSLSLAPDEQNVVALIKKMQQQLVFLEKKMDILIGQSSRPSRSFGRPHRPFDRAPGDASGEKRFDHKKKAYGDSRESNFGQDRNFARRNDGQKGGFDYKNKPFPYKRKGSR